MDITSKGNWDLIDWSSYERDPRTESWPLVTSPVPMLLLTGTYLIIVKYGPILMKDREPVDCKRPLLVYNAVMVILNAYITVTIVRGAYGASYSMICEEMKYTYDIDQMRVATGMWLYYVSKPLEFLDTFFFILRKKNDQLTFLHVYHHSTVFVLWWFFICWGAGGVSVFGPAYNSAVHVAMYSYYGLSAIPACRPFLWWKKYLTVFQLLQFVALALHLSSALVVGCQYPRWLLCLSLSYVITLIALFLNFYNRAYVNRERLPQPTVLTTKRD